MSQDEYFPNPKKLYRSRQDRMLAGVCGGFARYLGMDATLLRLLWIVVSLLWGIGIFLYIAAIFIVPEDPEELPPTESSEPQKHNNSLFWGGLFIVLGLLLLFQQLGFFSAIAYWNIPWKLIWAALLILLGAFLLLNRSGKNTVITDQQGEPITETGRTIYRPRTNRMIAGVCAGLAEYFNIDVTLVRLIYVLLTLASVGVGIVAYIIMVLAFPEEPASPDDELY